MTKIFVLGLAMRLRIANIIDSEDQIAGPLIYASLGCARFVKSPILLGSISNDVSKEELVLLESLGVALHQTSQVARPSLTLASHAVLGRTGIPRIIGDPGIWIPAIRHYEFSDSFLLAANCDPQWLDAILANSNPRFLAIDLHANWIASRAAALRRCLQKCVMLSLTQEELLLLPESLSTKLRRSKQTTLIIKRGRDGVTISQGDASCDLPAPTPKLLQSDLGAGDFLIGGMAGAIFSNFKGIPTIEDYSSAYMSCRGMVALLLESRCPKEFMCKLLANQPHSARVETASAVSENTF